ncbi:MAG: hypothetical protein ABI670_12420 [Chloroflexota bacterium]
MPEKARSPRALIITALLLAIVGLASVGLLTSNLTHTLSKADANATAESLQFATAQTARQSTRTAANATGTALAIASTTADAHAGATTQAYMVATSTAAAKATLEAPATLTVQARDFLEMQAQAEATVGVMEKTAEKVFGPSDGELEQAAGGNAKCDATVDGMTDFIVEARFTNPYSDEQNRWDYGFAFTNAGDDAQYFVAVDSDGGRFFTLQAPGYTIQYRDDARQLDLSNNGTNTLKAYVAGNVVHLYINGRFEATRDLADLHFGQDVGGPHGVLICTAMREEDSPDGNTTHYEGLTVWRVP